MTEQDPTNMNVAGDDSTVGIQVGAMHNSNVEVNVTPAGKTPEEKFRDGVQHLKAHSPGEAWKLIDAAAMAEYVTNEVVFYWYLALLSGRNLNHLPAEKAERLEYEQKQLRVSGDDAWARGVRMIHGFLALPENADPTAIDGLLADLADLPAEQRNLIVEHMDVFMNGQAKDQLWEQSIRLAKSRQMLEDREERAWMFFQPDPAGPRVRQTQEPELTRLTWAQAVTASVVLAGALGLIAYVLAEGGLLSMLVVYLLGITGGWFGVRAGAEWRFRTLRRDAKDRAYLPPPRPPAQRRKRASADDGFAAKVGQRVDHYFGKYVPRDTERDTWLNKTAGIRASMRDELVELYREQRIDVEEIAWLIRHKAGIVKSRYQRDILWQYQEELAAPLPMRTTTVLGLSSLAGGVLEAVAHALTVDPLLTSYAMLLALAGGWAAMGTWLRIFVEHRRVAADRHENARTLRAAKTAFERWQEKLSRRPDNQLMTDWLEADRMVLLGEVLRHYQLNMSAVLASAFIETPSRPTVAARMGSGPWRYKRYQIHIFVLTTDGVRRFRTDLDFESGKASSQERTNFRYDAVAAVRVAQVKGNERSLELRLVDGKNIEVHVVAWPEDHEPEDVESLEAAFEQMLDTTGLPQTLHILEGIAAEGKEWIEQDQRRARARFRDLTEGGDPLG